jgi:hypothetical protein
VVQPAVDPQLVQFFLDAVLRQAPVQRREIDAVNLLILVETRWLRPAAGPMIFRQELQGMFIIPDFPDEQRVS